MKRKKVFNLCSVLLIVLTLFTGHILNGALSTITTDGTNSAISAKTSGQSPVLSGGLQAMAATTVASTTTSGAAVRISSIYERSYSSADINVNIDSSYLGGSFTVTNVGVVYSTDNNAVNNNPGSCQKSQINYYSSSTVIQLNSLYSYNTYYVRPYIIINLPGRGEETIYGNYIEWFRLDDSSNYYPYTVNTLGVQAVYNNSARIAIEVPYTGYSPTVYDMGVVYSSSNSTPQLGYSNCYSYSTSVTSSPVSVTISGLSSYTTYYVRAYARYNDGDVRYGSVSQFTTNNNFDYGYDYYYENSYYGNDYYYYNNNYNNNYNYNYNSSITTSSVTNITDTTARAGGYSPSSLYNYSVSERGVVYSSTTQSPTISNSYVRASTFSSGSFTVDLTGLSRATTYYVRTYVRLSNGSYYYGSSTNFKTLGTASATATAAPSYNMASITVSFRALDGSLAGTQNITLASGSVINQYNLNLPMGYSIYDSNFSHMVTGSDTILVLVKPSSNEHMFVFGAGGNRFEPDKQITRADVAKMLFYLKERTAVDVRPVFNDVSSGHPDIAAINYVSSMGYMQGYPDGTFNPNDFITRAEVAAIACVVYNIPNNNQSNRFTDADEHWAKGFITGATEIGMLSGYPDGTFKPDAGMTKAEACALFTRAEKRSLTPLSSAQFVDVPNDHWAYKYIMNASVSSK